MSAPFNEFIFTLLSQKATKKTDKPRTEEVEVTDLTDEDLKEQLAKHGVDTGPIVGECRLRLFQEKRANPLSSNSRYKLFFFHCLFRRNTLTQNDAFIPDTSN